MIEPRFKEAIDAWVSIARPMAGFINAVLENDFIEAVGRADPEAYANLKDIVKYLYNDCPIGCWGSKDRVKAWRLLKHQNIEPE